MRLLLAALAATLLLPVPALLPAASAQPDFLSMEIEPFAGPLTPEAEEGEARVTVRVPCDAEDGADATSARFSLAEAPPAWLAASLSPEDARLAPGPCPAAGERVLEATLKARFTAEAPAFRAHVLRVLALVEGGDGAARELSADVSAQAEPVVRVVTRATPDTLPGARGEILTFPLQVTNQGNHHARVMVSVVDNPGSLNIVIPPMAVVESRQAGGASNQSTVYVQVQPGRLPEEGATFRIRVEPFSAFDPRLRGEAQEVTLRVEGAKDNLAPGLGLHGALLALVVGALVVRRAARGRTSGR